MNSRERFLKSMHFEPVDRSPYWVPWYWEETVDLWAAAGHTQLQNRGDFERAEEHIHGCDHKEHIRIWLSFEPPFEEETLEEDGQYLTSRSSKGITQKARKDQLKDTERRHSLQFPIESRSDYLNYRDRLTANVPLRVDRLGSIERHQTRDYPVSVRGTLDCGFYGPLWQLLGFNRVNRFFYEDPDLIEMMMDDRADLIIEMCKEILKRTTIDWFCFWEDMAYNSGAVIAPELFRKFLLPRYQRVTDFLHSHGVDIIFVDSDGDISLLIPLWLECGVNGMWPLEVRAGMDVLKLRKEYDRDLLLMGGLDKSEIAKGKEAIEREILKKVPPLIKDGGYIPRPDHTIPADVPYDNYMYFMEFLKITMEQG
jgi:uroporphyrinogen decarboxylase